MPAIAGSVGEAMHQALPHVRGLPQEKRRTLHRAGPVERGVGRAKADAAGSVAQAAQEAAPVARSSAVADDGTARPGR